MSGLNPAPQIVPDYQILMYPVLEMALHGENKISLIIDKLADDLALSEEGRSIMISSGRRTLFTAF